MCCSSRDCRNRKAPRQLQLLSCRTLFPGAVVAALALYASMIGPQMTGFCAATCSLVPAVAAGVWPGRSCVAGSSEEGGDPTVDHSTGVQLPEILLAALQDECWRSSKLIIPLQQAVPNGFCLRCGMPCLAACRGRAQLLQWQIAQQPNDHITWQRRPADDLLQPADDSQINKTT